jgi:antitoxin component of MazEF toxin-antitoxin module
MQPLTRKTDSKARITLPAGYANCLVTIEKHGDELRLRKVRKTLARRYSLKELVAQITPDNVHAEVKTGHAVGREVL